MSDAAPAADAASPAALGAAHDPERPRRLLEEVLARPEFHGGASSPSWLDGFLDRLFGNADRIPDWLGAGVTVAIGVAAAALIVYLLSEGRARRARRAHAENGGDPAAPAAREPARDLYRRGAAAAREGRHAEAVVLLFRAMVQRLTERGLLLADPSRTNREHLRDLGRRPRESEAVRSVLPAFERVRYGAAEAGPEEASRAAAAAALLFPEEAAEGSA